MRQRLELCSYKPQKAKGSPHDARTSREAWTAFPRACRGEHGPANTSILDF